MGIPAFEPRANDPVTVCRAIVPRYADDGLEKERNLRGQGLRLRSSSDSKLQLGSRDR